MKAWTAFSKLTTGAQGTITMHYRTVQEEGLLDDRNTVAGSAGGVGGQLQTREGTLTSFILGGHDFGEIRASFANENRGAFSNEMTAGNIGEELLRPFVLVFDYPHERIGFVKK